MYVLVIDNPLPHTWYLCTCTLIPNSSYTRDYCELIEWILVVDPEARPSIEEVQVRIESMLRAQQTTDDDESS